MRLAVLLLTSLTLFAQARRDRHVVIISIDGLAAYAFNDRSIPLPNLRRLASEGAAAEAMTVVNPAVTWPNHTSMVTGVTPARHTVIYNGLAQRRIRRCPGQSGTLGGQDRTRQSAHSV